MKWNYFKLLIVTLFFSNSKSDLFTSVSHTEDLIHFESQLVLALNEYIQAEEEKLKHIKSVTNNLQALSDHALSSIENYLGHPLNQYKLIRRLVSEWPQVEVLIKEDLTGRFVAIISRLRESLPNEDDAEGSATAIMRLQDTFELETHDIANGMIKGSRADQSLTADDCFQIGRTAYLDENYYHCVLWMNEALQTNDMGIMSTFEVLDYLSYCIAQQGNFQKALELTDEMLKIAPMHEEAQKRNKYYGRILAQLNVLGNSEDQHTPFTDLLVRPMEVEGMQTDKRFERLCRSHSVEVPRRQVARNLKCKLWTNSNHPRLILQPVKLEELWHSPQVVRFLDIISDEEMAEIKRIAKPLLNRAEVFNERNGGGYAVDYRVGKTAWLEENDSLIVAKLSRRVSDLTGLSIETAELLQIANYGIGGHYLPHPDYSTPDAASRFFKKIGNRIATLLIYLSDVEYGGNTVFLEPGIAAEPIKGSAVFWYNLFPSGVVDERTVHGACPVLIGNKWVANKWIHEVGNEFSRPCGLSPVADNKFFCT